MQHNTDAVIIVAVLIIIGIVMLTGKKKKHHKSGFASGGWVVYLNKGCHYCHKQMDELKANGLTCAHVMYDRDGTLLEDTRPDQSQPRLAFGTIRGYPFWSNAGTGETKVGLQQGAALKSMM